MKSTVSLLLAAAIFGVASPALACRSYQPPSAAEVQERQSLFIARVESIERSAINDGTRVRVILATEQRIEGEPEAVSIAEADFGPDREDWVIADCSQGHPLASELDMLVVGDEVVASAWRRNSGEFHVTFAARRDRTAARLLLNAPRP